ncbi:MAG: Rieske 2Fe-2S domain-containing protein [Elusimicrobia bacterium]|nr:Rieske 2Fe-2S domain-containing protein [Elusimicrobiota bacterium]MBI4218046.1 Rieske 2Fe-2S domain-containing protein [Elusimicrobiota bacterium]
MAEKLVYVCEADLKNGEMRGLKVEGQWLLIVRHKNQYHALDASCAHSGYPLFKGDLSADGIITCSLHHAQFECPTGTVVSDPAICENQPRFSIEVKEGKVFWVKELTGHTP